jgi:hypothetical protein
MKLNGIRSWQAVLALLLFGVGTLWGQGNGKAPGDAPGSDFVVVVTPGVNAGSLNFTYGGCSTRCDQIPVRASNDKKRNSVTWKFRFSGEKVLMAQINFTAGTPFFQARENRRNNRRKHYDDHSASTPGASLGFAEIRKFMKTVGWRAAEGLGEIEDGDEFKYDAFVITEKDGVQKVYVADPIVIVRGVEDDGGA